MSAHTLSDYVKIAFEHVPLFTIISSITGVNDPIGTGITAGVEVMLTPVIDNIYQSVLGKKMPIHSEEVRNAKYSSSTFAEISVYFSTSCLLTYVSAQVSKKLGHEINVPKYLLMANLTKFGFSLAKRELNRRVQILYPS